MRHVVIALLVLTGLSCAEGTDPDLILYNGLVWTADDELPTATAVAINGERIVAVGEDDMVTGLAGPETESLDMAGAFLVPGFNDSHVHFASAARFLEFNIMRTSTQQEFVDRVNEVVESLESGEWITGGFWGAYDQWEEGSAGGSRRDPFVPDLRLVDDATDANPMLIRKFDNSEFAANRAALILAGIDVANPVAEDVEFETDVDGAATGLIKGAGVAALFRDIVPSTLSVERRRSQTLKALEVVRSFGVTTVSDMSDDQQLNLYRELLKEGRLTVRVDFRYPLDRWEDAAEGRRLSDRWIRLGAVKGHVDGIMGTSSARFFEPYDHDPGNRGRWRRLMVDENGNFAEGQFLQFMVDADAAGVQLSIHAIGDEANSLLLDYQAEMDRLNGARDRRFRLVHAQVIGEKDFERLGSLNIVAEVQPFHLSDDMRWMEERIGHERSRGAYAFRRIEDTGAILSFGSDWPGTSAAEYPINPMLGLYAAVTRQTVTGQPDGGWFPEERISMEDALRAYTLNPAYATFEEGIKGSIKAGKLADIAVLDRNLLEITPEEILDTRVLMTIVGGRIVYRTDV